MERLAPGCSAGSAQTSPECGCIQSDFDPRHPGYRVFKHTDSLWKGITVKLYLPPDNSITHIGTIFHERLPERAEAQEKADAIRAKYRLRLCRG